MKSLLPLLSLLVGLLFFSGCATVMHGGGKQRLGISSSPSDATVVIDDSTHGVTPFTTKLDRDKPHKIVITKEGYEDASATAVPKVSGWVFGNIVIGGLIGLGVDFISGGAYNLNPDTVNITLQKRNTALATAPVIAEATPPVTAEATGPMTADATVPTTTEAKATVTAPTAIQSPPIRE